MTYRGLPIDDGLISWETHIVSETNQIFFSPKFLGIIPLSQKLRIISVTEEQTLDKICNPFPIASQILSHLGRYRTTKQLTWYQIQFQTEGTWADIGDKSITEQESMTRVKQHYPGYLIGKPRLNILIKQVLKPPKTISIVLGLALTIALGIVLRSLLSGLISHGFQFITNNLLN